LVSLLKRSVAIRRVWHAIRHSLGSESTLKPWRPDRRYLELCRPDLSEDAQADVAESRRLLNEIRQQVEAQGARLLVVTIPVSSNWQDELQAGRERGDDRPELPDRRVSEFLEQQGVPHLSLYDAIDQVSTGSAPLYFAHDGHLNAAGNAFVAEQIAPWLASQLSDARLAKRP
jgi:hypothetical protein